MNQTRSGRYYWWINIILLFRAHLAANEAAEYCLSNGRGKGQSSVILIWCCCWQFLLLWTVFWRYKFVTHLICCLVLTVGRYLLIHSMILIIRYLFIIIYQISRDDDVTPLFRIILGIFRSITSNGKNLRINAEYANNKY